MSKTKYVLARVTMTGVPSFYCDGLKIKDEFATEDEHHGGSSNRLSVTFKKRKVEFELVNPRDHMSLNQIAYRCRKGETFTITAFGEDEKGVFRALERLDGCIIPGRERTIGAFDAVKFTVKGTADNAEPLDATYA